ncbi:coiled-coil domain-containing protein 180 isoform X2 [Nothobranchius furzeri]|uniref:coiled-coil domain-containing protein 180 isoform X2 n=1 Tax=Nothobranchius furzeri TaxID=105023 RepID=UPI0039047148
MSREVPSGEVNRQLFDAQTQLSKSLRAGRRDMRTECVSSADSNTTCEFCSSSCTRQQRDDEGDEDDVSRLPDSIETSHLTSGILDKLAQKTRQKHDEALKQMDTHLTHLSQACETEVRTLCEQLKSSLQKANLRLDTLKDRMGHLQHSSLQEVLSLWEEVHEEVKERKNRFSELNLQLNDCERQRTDELRAILRTHSQLLEEIRFLPSSEVHRLIHKEATKLNVALLANRRSIAQLLLHLKEDNLQQEFLLHLQWEERLNSWRSIRISGLVERFRTFFSSVVGRQPLSGQQMKQTQEDLTQQRRDVIQQIRTMAPPTISSTAVSDWFNQLTAVNQQIDQHHTDFLRQLKRLRQQTWQDCLAEAEKCKEALSALQLSEEQVNCIISPKLLPLIEGLKSQDEAQLAALKVSRDSLSHHSAGASKCVFDVMRAVALLWETHCRRMETREAELQKHLGDIKQSQQQFIQRKMARVDVPMKDLRQESSEESLKTSLDNISLLVLDIEDRVHSFRSDQKKVVDLLPSLFLKDLDLYRSSIISFFQLNRVSSRTTKARGGTGKGKSKTIQMEKESEPILMKAKSALSKLYDISTNITICPSEGVAYNGPAFSYPAADLPEDLQHKEHLTPFPAELLESTLSQFRVTVLTHLENGFQDLLNMSAAVVTGTMNKDRSELEPLLQPLKPENILTNVYEPRLAELILHQQRVDVHCQEIFDLMTSCRTELKQLETSITMKTQDLSSSLSSMEDDVQTARSSSCLAVVSTTMQDLLDHHVEDVQRCWSGFRQMVRTRLQEARTRTSDLLTSFRTFSEGGDFSPQEVGKYQIRMEKEIRKMRSIRKSILAELEFLESTSQQQVKEASAALEKKLADKKSELEVIKKIQELISRTQTQIKDEAGSSNLQQAEISSRLEELGRMTRSTQVSPDQLCSFLSSTHEEITKRFRYLELDHSKLSADPESRKQVEGSPQSGPQLLSRTTVDPPEDPVLGTSRVQDPGRGLSSVQEWQSSVDSVISQRGSGSRTKTDDITAEKGFRFLGFEQETEPNACSFSSSVNSVLWKTKNEIRNLTEDTCCSLDSTQQRLLGYQDQASVFLRASKTELLKQMAEFQELLSPLPAFLISNHEQRHRSQLAEDVGVARRRLEELLAASEEEKLVALCHQRSNFHKLRVSLTADELQALNAREELRQQQLHSATWSMHQELQKCVRSRTEEFVTSLASLSENLLLLLDDLLTPAVTHQHTEHKAVTMETGAETGRGRRTWPGISFLFTPTKDSDPSTPVTMTTEDIITTTYSQKHEEVIVNRDAAVKRFEKLFSSETSCSDSENQRHLSEQQRWNTHWQQQIHSLTQIHTM